MSPQLWFILNGLMNHWFCWLFFIKLKYLLNDKLKNTKESKFKPQKQWISTEFVLYHHKISLRDKNHWSHKTHTKLCINCSNDSKLNLENIKIKMMILCIVAVKTIAKRKQRRSREEVKKKQRRSKALKKKQNFCAYKRKSQIVNHKLK